MPTVLVCYDISRDDSRARIAATLQIWGERIQRSVFICTLEPADLADLTARVAAIMDTRTDAVHIGPVAAPVGMGSPCSGRPPWTRTSCTGQCCESDDQA